MFVSNTAEGGTNGVTVSTGNSGGASGTAFDSVTTGSGTLQYSNAQAMRGSLSILHSTGGTTALTNFTWSTAIGTPSRIWIRFYIRSTDVTTAHSFARVRNGTTLVTRFGFNASGQLEVRNTSGTTVATSTFAMSNDTWYRIEADIRPGNTIQNTFRIFTGHSTSAEEELTPTANFSTETTVDEVTFGNVISAANLPTKYLDDLAVGDTTWVGPSATSLADDSDGISPLPGTTPGKSALGLAASLRFRSPMPGQTPTRSALTLDADSVARSPLPGSSSARSAIGRGTAARGIAPLTGVSRLDSSRSRVDQSVPLGLLAGSMRVVSSLGLASATRGATASWSGTAVSSSLASSLSDTIVSVCPMAYGASFASAVSLAHRAGGSLVLGQMRVASALSLRSLLASLAEAGLGLVDSTLAGDVADDLRSIGLLLGSTRVLSLLGIPVDDELGAIVVEIGDRPYRLDLASGAITVDVGSQTWRS